MSAPGDRRTSPSPIRVAPSTARAIPHRSRLAGCSPSHSAAIAHTKTGRRLTSNTELATVVKRSEAIQVQKWAASMSPDSTINARARPSVARSATASRRDSASVTGSTSAKRQNDTARAGAAANRTIGPA